MEELKIQQASEIVRLNTGKKGKTATCAPPAKKAAPAGPSRWSGQLSSGGDVEMPHTDAMEVEDAERGDEDTQPAQEGDVQPAPATSQPRACPTYHGTPGNPRISGISDAESNGDTLLPPTDNSDSEGVVLLPPNVSTPIVPNPALTSTTQAEGGVPPIPHVCMPIVPNPALPSTTQAEGGVPPIPHVSMPIVPSTTQGEGGVLPIIPSKPLL
ncbi:hypothetical protein DFH06DRAFT_1326805 [Mycena polygramma]|nr:hypothetical protein DFH06DRAFT_1326805 [Mycena polygramma]